MTILTVCFCFHFRSVVNMIPTMFLKKHISLAEKLISIVPLLLICTLVIWCLKKTLKYDAYGSHTPHMCSILSNDIKKRKDYKVITNLEPERISYYSNIDFERISALGGSEKEYSIDSIKDIISVLKNLEKTYYFVFLIKKNDIEPTQSSLCLDNDSGKWSCIYREYTSQRRNKEIVLYRFEPALPNIIRWRGDIPGLPSNNLVRNGDFEVFLENSLLEERIEYYREKNIISYTDLTRKIPANWILDLGEWNSNDPPEMELISDNPIEGKHSLFLDSLQSSFYATFCTPEISKGNNDYDFSFFVRNDNIDQAEMNILIQSWNSSKKQVVDWDQILLTLEPGELYRIQGVAKNSLIDYETFRICIAVKGKVVLDQFSLTKKEQQ